MTSLFCLVHLRRTTLLRKYAVALPGPHFLWKFVIYQPNFCTTSNCYLSLSQHVPTEMTARKIIQAELVKLRPRLQDNARGENGRIFLRIGLAFTRQRVTRPKTVKRSGEKKRWPKWNFFEYAKLYLGTFVM